MHVDNIQQFMKEVFLTYKEIINSGSIKQFWDLVILTTFDDDQKKSFERQLETFLDINPLLKGRLFVVADLPNRKLGCGGSTLHVLKTLNERFGSELYKKQILIIHSGGYSQRLPSYSLQGKIFSPMPIKELSNGGKVSQMLDLKLAMYLPFRQLLSRPGVFVACGDDIETFSFDHHQISHEQLNKADVIALAHPCNLDTATGHGVYILPTSSALKEDSAFVSDCLEVLQKPSISLMKEKNAILRKTVLGKSEEIVYSDSVFWMSENAYRPLMDWYCTATSVVELDAYAHFLPCLGLNMKNEKHNHDVDTYKSQLIPIFRDLDFKLIVLNSSKFYHIGTMKEYLDHFTISKAFQKELNLCKYNGNFNETFELELKDKGNSAIISSYLKNANLIKMQEHIQVVIEWCVIELEIRVMSDLILSNCSVQKCPGVKLVDEPVSFLGNFLYHTVPLRFSGTLKYVTVAFEISADLKQGYSNINSITIASVPLDMILKKTDLETSQVLANGVPYSLWNLKLFKGSATAEESFWRTHHFIQKIISSRGDKTPIQTELSLENSCPLFSMKEILELKDLEVFLSDRNKVLELINR